jgi:hypothetical protein
MMGATTVIYPAYNVAGAWAWAQKRLKQGSAPILCLQGPALPLLLIAILGAQIVVMWYIYLYHTIFVAYCLFKSEFWFYLFRTSKILRYSSFACPRCPSTPLQLVMQVYTLKWEWARC